MGKHQETTTPSGALEQGTCCPKADWRYYESPVVEQGSTDMNGVCVCVCVPVCSWFALLNKD